MTSKEALKSMCNHCEKLSIRDGFIGCPYRCISNDYCEEFETIKKDLEVLEILKNYSDYYTCCDTYGYGESCLNIVIHDDIEEYTIIKEWLEDENNT